MPHHPGPPQLMVGPDIPSEKVRVLLEDGDLAVEQVVREAAESPRVYDRVFGHDWDSRHAYFTGESRDGVDVKNCGRK